MSARRRTGSWLRGGALLLTGVVLGAGLMVLRGAEAETVKPTPVDYSRYRKLDLFGRALAIIEQHYVRPVDSERLLYAAIGGLVAATALTLLVIPCAYSLFPGRRRAVWASMTGED